MRARALPPTPPSLIPGKTPGMILRVMPGVLLGVLLTASASAQLPPGTSDASSSSREPTPGSTDALRAQAAAAIERNDMPSALKYLQQLNEREPESAPILFNLGSAQDALDQVSNAEASYRHASRILPGYLEPHLALGLLLARTNHPAEARAELLAATTADAGTSILKARAFRALAELDRNRDPAGARDALLAALKLTPETPEDALLSASLAEQSGDPAAAETAYRRVLAKSPGDPDATAALARVLVGADKLSEAEPLLSAALTASPGEPRLTAQLASLYVRQGDRAKALALVAPLHAAHPGEPSVTRLYARLLAQHGDYAAAEPLFAGLRTAAPTDPELLDDDADTLVHLKRFAEAEDLLKRAIAAPGAFRTQEALGEAAAHLAFAASQNNDPQVVLQAVSLHATVLPQSPALLFLEAISRDKLHQIKPAQQLYRQFLKTSAGKFPDEEWEAQHRLVALEHTR